MHRLTPSLFALALLVFANGCASTHKHAEVPDFTETGWSEPNPAYAQSKADSSIQPPSPKNDEAATTTTTSAEIPASPGTGAADTPIGTQAAESSAPVAPKPAKVKKGAARKKGKKKNAKAS